MERRVLLAIFLSFLVLYAYQVFFLPKPAQKPRGRADSAQTPRADRAKAPEDADAGGSRAPAAELSGAAEPDIDATVADETERRVVVDTATVRAVFTNRGARLISWQLKQFSDERGRWVDLVPAELPADHAHPFALKTADAALTRILNDALFKVLGNSGSAVDGTRSPARLVFEYQNQKGLRARKEFLLDPHSYVIGFSASVSVDDDRLNPMVQWGPGLGDVASDREASGYFQQPAGIIHREGGVEHLSPKDLVEHSVYEGDLRFAGIDDHYFLAAVLPRGAKTRVEYQPVSINNPGSPSPPRALVAYSVRLDEGASTSRFFFGPKDFDVLAAVDPELVRAINFGWFAFLVVPLLRSLKWINGYVGNYGWSIIILTVFINAAMFPLRHKSVVSMRKMQELQPEVKAIQDRYAKLKVSDPARQKMNTELMALYRERGVNPASGCIPMLLTMPVLIAFYSLLSQAIEIRGAPFTLWIQDLSAHDPLYVTPILMGLSMVWQMRMTPTATDPTQQKMMMIMPIVFTFMFLWAPSGLVLYWLVSNIWAIGQQHVTNWLIGPPVVRVPRPAAERRMKRAGGARAEKAEKNA